MLKTVITFDINKYKNFEPYRNRWLKTIEDRFPNKKFMFFIKDSDGNDQKVSHNMTFEEVKYFVKNIYVSIY